MQLSETEISTLRSGATMRVTTSDIECVVIRADLYDKLYEDSDGECHVHYIVADEAMREGWESAGMAEYDNYEAHRK